ncbi:hypothetical protein YPPY01_1020, partial [Yersinia pestis PY-01]
MNGEDRQ